MPMRQQKPFPETMVTEIRGYVASLGPSELTLKRLGHFFQNVILISNVVQH